MGFNMVQRGQGCLWQPKCTGNFTHPHPHPHPHAIWSSADSFLIFEGGRAAKGQNNLMIPAHAQIPFFQANLDDAEDVVIYLPNTPLGLITKHFPRVEIHTRLTSKSKVLSRTSESAPLLTIQAAQNKSIQCIKYPQILPNRNYSYCR